MQGLVPLFCIFISFNALSSIPNKNFQLKPQLKKDFVTLVSKAKDFHKLMQEGGDKQTFQKETLETEKIIKQLYPKVLTMAHLQKRLHSYKLLQSLEENLAVLKNEGSGNKRVVKKFFKSFFELVQVYDLKKDMSGKIFYCFKDKSTWFQSGSKPNNPINSNFKNCGQVI